MAYGRRGVNGQPAQRHARVVSVSARVHVVTLSQGTMEGIARDQEMRMGFAIPRPVQTRVSSVK